MRIIAGSARGRKLFAPEGEETRPTLDRVKEAVFGMLQFSLSGSSVLDLFAGSGNMGLEALSRGAALAVFNDKSPKSCAVIKKNIETLGFADRSRLLRLDYRQALAQLAQEKLTFRFAFLDPPYVQGPQAAAELLFRSGLMEKGGLVIAEHAWESPVKPVPGLMRCRSDRKYGYVGVCILEDDRTE